MAKILKKIDYDSLVILIYLMANYNKKKAILLYRYTAHYIIESQFNVMYIEKLAYDLNLIDIDNKDIIRFDDIKDNFITNITNMDKEFTHLEIINFKSILWDILHKGYYY